MSRVALACLGQLGASYVVAALKFRGGPEDVNSNTTFIGLLIIAIILAFGAITYIAVFFECIAVKKVTRVVCPPPPEKEQEAVIIQDAVSHPWLVQTPGGLPGTEETVHFSPCDSMMTPPAPCEPPAGLPGQPPLVCEAGQIFPAYRAVVNEPDEDMHLCICESCDEVISPPCPPCPMPTLDMYMDKELQRSLSPINFTKAAQFESGSEISSPTSSPAPPSGKVKTQLMTISPRSSSPNRLKWRGFAHVSPMSSAESPRVFSPLGSGRQHSRLKYYHPHYHRQRYFRSAPLLIKRPHYISTVTWVPAHRHIKRTTFIRSVPTMDESQSPESLPFYSYQSSPSPGHPKSIRSFQSPPPISNTNTHENCEGGSQTSDVNSTGKGEISCRGWIKCLPDSDLPEENAQT